MSERSEELELLIHEQERDDLWGHIVDRLPFILPLDLLEIDHATRAQARPRRPRFQSGRIVKRIKRSSEVVCGDESMYLRGCRCESCCEGRRTATEKRRRALGVKPKGVPQHGTISGYQKLKCRCDSCRAANATYMRDYRAKKAA